MSFTAENFRELKELATATKVAVGRLQQRVHFYYNIIVLDSEEKQIEEDFFKDFRELNNLLPKLQQVVDRINFNRCYAHDSHIQYTDAAERVIDNCRKELIQIYIANRVL